MLRFTFSVLMCLVLGCGVEEPRVAGAEQTLEAMPPVPLFPTPPLVRVGPAAALAASSGATFNGWGWGLGASAAVRYPVALPQGAKLTGWQLYLQRANASSTTSARLQCQTADGTHTDVGQVAGCSTGATGAISIDAPFAAPIDVSAACTSYSLLVIGGAVTGDTTIGLEVFGTPPERTAVIDVFSAAVRQGWSVDWTGYNGTSRGFLSSSAEGRFALPMHLHEGDHIRSLTFAMEGTGSVNVDVASVLIRPDGSATLGVACVGNFLSVAQTRADYHVTCVDTKVQPGDDWWLEFHASSAGARVSATRLTYEPGLEVLR